MAGSNRRAVSSGRGRRSLAESVSALKERIYASFTGLAIVTVLALDVSHTSPQAAFGALSAGIVGITLAGLAAEVIVHLVTHQSAPTWRELGAMVRIAAGAIGSASSSLIAISLALIGVIELETALRIGVGLYIATLCVVTLIAARQTAVSVRYQLFSLAGLVGLAAATVGVLTLAH